MAVVVGDGDVVCALVGDVVCALVGDVVCALVGDVVCALVGGVVCALVDVDLNLSSMQGLAIHLVLNQLHIHCHTHHLIQTQNQCRNHHQKNHKYL